MSFLISRSEGAHADLPGSRYGLGLESFRSYLAAELESELEEDSEQIAQ